MKRRSYYLFSAPEKYLYDGKSDFQRPQRLALWQHRNEVKDIGYTAYPYYGAKRSCAGKPPWCFVRDENWQVTVSNSLLVTRLSSADWQA
jgi:hypothetical protein